jgi:Nucleotidyltransferase domain
MSMAEVSQSPRLASALAAHGLSLDLLAEQASAIALFGSRANDCARPASDWDVLCVGPGRTRKLAGLDLVWVEARAIEQQDWLGSDLAGHVAAYGTWLHGAAPWRAADLRFDLAAQRKEERIGRRIRSLARSWELLGPAYRDKYATLVRRDAQRLEGFMGRAPVRPTAWLDAAWRAPGDATRWLSEQLRLLGAEPRLIEALIDHAIAAPGRFRGRAVMPDPALAP